jgi:hypothetical protein
MKPFEDSSARARRLLKFYPSTWRERYGNEFIDFMEQSIADTPHNAKRTANIIYKGAKVRVADLGIVGPTLDEARVPNVALGTTTFLASVFAVFALFYWSTAMISWNSNPTAVTSFGVTIWMGAITVSAMVLTLTLLTIGLTLLVRAWRKAFLEHNRPLFMLLFVVIASAAAIVNSCFQYTRWVIARGGIDWAKPGIAVKQIAGSTQWITQSTIWGPSWTGWHFFSSDGPLHYGTPIAVIVLALSTAKVARRLDFSANANRAARTATKFLSLSMAAFLLSFAGWTLAGGFNRSWVAPFTQMDTSLFWLITFIAILSLVILFKNRTLRNAITVVKS